MNLITVKDMGIIHLVIIGRILGEYTEGKSFKEVCPNG